jgi:uncharacterized membrane protein YdjX (TVP38/TMEM64 family)
MPPDPTYKPSFSFRKAIPLIVLAVGLLVFLAFNLDHYLTIESLHENRDFLLDFVARQAVLSALIYVGLYILAVAFSIPGGLFLTLLGGFLFGTMFGTLYAIIGATVGATALFLAARLAFTQTLRARAGNAMRKMEAGFREHALSYLLILRLIPLFPFWLVNLAPALLGVSLRTYLIGTFLGILPATLIFASIGNGLGVVLDTGETLDAGIVMRPEILFPLLGLAAIAALPVLYKKWKSRRA